MYTRDGINGKRGFRIDPASATAFIARRLSISLCSGLVVPHLVSGGLFPAVRYRKNGLELVKTQLLFQIVTHLFFYLIILLHFCRVTFCCEKRRSEYNAFPFLSILLPPFLSLSLCFVFSICFYLFLLSCRFLPQRDTGNRGHEAASICSRKLNLRDIPAEELVNGDY